MMWLTSAGDSQQALEPVTMGIMGQRVIPHTAGEVQNLPRVVHCELKATVPRKLRGYRAVEEGILR